ncbi:MAG: LysR family transcriptional regulator [Pseudomonadota bacterium]
MSNVEKEFTPVGSVGGDTIPPALLFEMTRSFVTLSRTLNLSHAVKEMGTTRQTLRRHITLLEEALGFDLFTITDRRYSLTENALRALPVAQEILALGTLWIQGKATSHQGLSTLAVDDDEDWFFYQQQQPMSSIWDSRSKLLRAAVSAWSASGGELESPEMQAVRPYMLVYRESPNGWICVEVGESSIFTQWWGWANARSSIGRPLNQLPGGDELALLMEVPLREVRATHGMRLDQVVTKMPRSSGAPPQVIVFDRLLLGARFPDGSFALISVVDRPGSIAIDGLEPSILKEMPEDVKTDF